MQIILIAGPSGSGKTTIANKLVEHYGEKRCLRFSLDWYYRDFSHITDPAERAAINFDDPQSVELDLAVRHLEALKYGLSVDTPSYDFATHTRVKGELPHHLDVTGKDFIIVEGIFALQPELQKLGDVKVYVDTDHGLCLARRMQRDVMERGRTLDSVLQQYLATVYPMQKKHVEPSKTFADVVIVDESMDFKIDITPITNKIEKVGGLELLSEGYAAARSAMGVLTTFKAYATQKMEAVDAAAHAFLAEGAHPEAFK